MKRLLFAMAAVAGLALGAASGLPAADAAGIRLMNFTPGAFENVVTGGSAHYYLTYSLENGREDSARPKLRIELRTDTDKTYGDTYDAPTFEAVAKASRSDEARKSTTQICAADLAGGASVDGLAHFGRIDPNADELEVRVYGLWDPISRDRKGNVYSERRVLVLKYARQGDEYNRPDDPIRLVSRSEELEGEPVLLISAK